MKRVMDARTRTMLRGATTTAMAAKTISGRDRKQAYKTKPITLPKLKCLEKNPA